MSRVLVVDDELYVREMLRRALSRWGYDVVEAENGSDALEKHQQVSPDIVLLDVAMPVMDGFEALRRLRESPSSADTPVILVTTYPASEGEPIAMSLGCQHYISKPFDLDLLKSTMKVALRESQTSSGEPADPPAVSPAPPSQTGVGMDSAQERPVAETATAGGLRTGIQLVDDELVGGISQQSLTLIEGTSAVGKSVLCYHLIYCSLLDQQEVFYISSEGTDQSVTAGMSSLGMNVSTYFQQGQLQIGCFKALNLEADSDHAVAALAQMFGEVPQSHSITIVDAIANQSIYGQEEDIVTLFQVCRDQCQGGRTICLVTHSAILEEKLWLKLRSLLDNHIRLSLKPMGRNLVKTLEVLKLNNAEVDSGNRIAFDVHQGVGIVPTRISDSTP